MKRRIFFRFKKKNYPQTEYSKKKKNIGEKFSRVIRIVSRSIYYY